MKQISIHHQNTFVKPSEKGQTMVIITIAMLALIGMLALVLDGGFSYAARRSAQNAADAGALAGANVLCGLQTGNAYNTAWEYAVTRNHADDADIVIGTSEVQVTATVNHDSFFAGIFGQDVVTVTAYAEAGCYNPCVAAVLPVAWACAPPAGETLEDDCNLETGTEENPGPLYVIMDSEKAEVDYQCQDPPNSGLPAGTLDCDVNDDGENEYIGGGGRSWLNLDGGGTNAGELKDWINGTKPLIEIPIHMWLGGGGGLDNSIYKEVQDYLVGKIVLVPVFNDYAEDCDPRPEEDLPGEDPLCDDKWHDDLDDLRESNIPNYYHVISFSLFKITGVSRGNNNCEPEDGCPAKDWLVSLGWLTKHAATIEGFFLEGYQDGMEGKCTNYGGAITIYLNH